MGKKARAAGGTSLVIVESPAKARTISKFLAGATRLRPASAISATCPKAPKRCPKSIRRRTGPTSASTSTTTSSPFTSSPEKRASRSATQNPAERRQRTVPGDGRRPGGRSDQLAPLRGAAAESAGPSAGVPRDYRGGDPRCVGKPPPDRRPSGPGPGSSSHRRSVVRLRRFSTVVA